MKTKIFRKFFLAIAAAVVTAAANATPQDCLDEYFSHLFSPRAAKIPAKFSIPKTERQRILLHSTMWPTEMDSRGKFAAMIGHKKFACAEIAFNDLDREGIAFGNGNAKTIALLKSAIDVARWQRGLSALEVKKLMEAWKAMAPDSVIADIYWVRLLNSAAWEARGPGFSSEVSKDQWKEFKALNFEAKSRMESASSQAKAHRLWPYAVQYVMADGGASQKELEDYLLEQLKRFPDEIDYLLLPAERLTNKWGGTPEQFERFAQRALAATRATHGNKVYARLYTMFIPSKNLQSNIHVRKEVLRAGLMEYTQQPFDSEAFSNLQDFACASKDEEAHRFVANVLMSYSPSERPRLPQMDSACRQWAIQLDTTTK
ncbi:MULTISPECIES: hypothetical protein [unclassified Acidovorax]|uniref:hypothetical protein n=1 Tax=unclassified Acidovorax TaxID=2684926 RepID=UPI000B2F21E2|nr:MULTISPECIES: hypothetical protein [unclassified Acidovorax]